MLGGQSGPDGEESRVAISTIPPHDPAPDTERPVSSAGYAQGSPKHPAKACAEWWTSTSSIRRPPSVRPIWLA